MTALSGLAIRAGTGNDTVDNFGTVTGNVNLGAGTNAFNNRAGGLFNMGASVDLGAGNLLTNAGTLSPGRIGAIQTTALTGNLVFSTGSFFAVDVTPTSADRLNVTGTATLAGTVQARFAPGNYLVNQYTILSASAGLGGTRFNDVVSINLFNFISTLSYTETDVRLSLVAALGRPASLPANQQNVASAIDAFFNAGGALPPGFLTLYGLTGSNLVNGLSQVSGQTPGGASLAAMQMMNSFLSLTLNPYGGAPNGNAGAIGYARAVGAAETLPQDVADAYAAIMPVKAAPAASFASRWSVWGQGFGGYNKTGGDANAGTTDTTARIWGFAAGADYRVTPNTLIGFALAGGELNWRLSQGLGSGKSDVFQAGLYGSHRFGAAYVSGAVAFAWYDMHTDRTVTVAGSDTLRAEFDAHSIGARIETGYRFATPYLGITPYGAAQVQNFKTPAYSEFATFGSGTFALSYQLPRRHRDPLRAGLLVRQNDPVRQR